MTTTLRLFVYCTDKGQHQRARLGELNLFENLNGEWVGGSNILGQHLNFVPEHAVGVSLDRDRGRVEIQCPRCPRHVQWRDERAKDVVVGLCAGSPIKGDADGLNWREAWLDISHLP